MHPVEIRDALDSMVLLVDTREQDTPALRKRLEASGRPFERATLKSGDYSARFILPDGSSCSLADRVVVERKMSAGEISQNFTRNRDRFIREFERLKAAGTRSHLIIENSSWEDIAGHNYRTLFAPRAFIASLMAWQARYDVRIHFCRPETTGWLIERILYYELKEMLESGAFG